MTKISYIHGVEPSELADRGKQIQPAQYIPYTKMTQGELKLALLREQAAVYAHAYPEVKNFTKAVQLYDKALAAGVHSRIAFIGAIPDDLQQVARQIRSAEKFTAPAAGRFYTARSVNGVHLGDPPIIPASITETCEDYATRVTNAFYHSNYNTLQWKGMSSVLPGPQKAKKERWLSNVAACQVQKNIEAIYNQRLQSSSHHVLYNELSANWGPLVGSRVDVKRLLHLAGVSALAGGADLNPSLMTTWVETGILRSNASGGVGPVGSIRSSFYLANDPEKLFDAYNAAVTKDQKVRVGVITEAVTLAIIALISASVQAAASIAKQVMAQRAGAFSAANGFGTPAYSAIKSDWIDVNGDGIPDQPATKTKGGSLLPIGLLVAGAFFLSE